jgi:mannose-6-phosphate isomerase-like protein (cupin superfamily)
MPCVNRLYGILALFGFLSFLAAGVQGAEERSVAPTWLYRHLPNLPETKTDFSTATCHYRAAFGEGDAQAGIARSVSRYGEITVDPGGACAEVTYPRVEEVYVVMEGAGEVLYAGGRHPVKKFDFLYLPPTVAHAVANPSGAPLRLIVMGFRIPPGIEIKVPATLQIANIEDVPLQVVGGHPADAKYRLLMGTTESRRDRIAAAHVLTSLFVMEFEPGATNFPHHHDREEEIYLVYSGTGEIVAGGGMDGVMGKHPAKPGDAYFFRLNCTVGFYASAQRGEKAKILAARSLYPFGKR